MDIGVITAPATEEAKQWQGYGTALKPAFEPIVVARKPLKGTVAQNVLEYGTGAINIDACRVHSGPSSGGSISGETALGQGSGWNAHNNRTTAIDRSMSAGRWPTNVVLDEHAAAELDAQTKPTKSTGGKTSRTTFKNVYGEYANAVPCGEYANAGGLGDEGGVSRYFPVFKYQAKAPAKERPKVEGVAHPTVKPIELFRWLVRLVAPQGATVIDPFAGSGTTGEAALLEGRNCILIEREADYIPLILTRIERQGLQEEPVA